MSLQDANVVNPAGKRRVAIVIANRHRGLKFGIPVNKEGTTWQQPLCAD
jgi:hypothetical protein